jgi:hypothetical protein
MPRAWAGQNLSNSSPVGLLSQSGSVMTTAVEDGESDAWSAVGAARPPTTVIAAARTMKLRNGADSIFLSLVNRF